MAGSMTSSAQCSCDDEIDRVEEGLLAVAIVTGLQMAVWLGVAIWYVVCTMCSKKLSKDEMEERSRDEWEEGVTKMEGCLKANKKKRKSKREEAWKNEEYKQKLAAWKKEEAAWKKEGRIEEENQQFLNAYKRAAESQL